MPDAERVGTNATETAATETSIRRCDLAYGLFLGLALVVPLAGPVLYLLLAEAGMMAHIFVLTSALPVALLAVLLSLAAWREWPLLVLSGLAVLSAIGFARGLATLEPTGVAFIVAALGFGGRWFVKRRRELRDAR